MSYELGPFLSPPPKLAAYLEGLIAELSEILYLSPIGLRQRGPRAETGCILLLEAMGIPARPWREGRKDLGAAGGQGEEQRRWGLGRLLCFPSFSSSHMGPCDPEMPVTPHCSPRDLLLIQGLGRFSWEKFTLGFLCLSPALVPAVQLPGSDTFSNFL